MVRLSYDHNYEAEKFMLFGALFLKNPVGCFVVVFMVQTNQQDVCDVCDW